jgi:hypothetical protein
MSTSSELTTSELPEWAKPYFPDLLKSAAGIANQPYQAYGGTRFAGYNPLETAAYGGLGSLGPSSYLSDAAKMASGAGAAAGSIGQDYTKTATDPAAMAKYMSPYMQNVVEQQKRGAVQDYSRQIPGMQASAARVGGMGGTRNALARSEAQRNLQGQLQGIQATGTQQAFQNAQQAQQFGANLGLQGLGQQLGAAQVVGGLGQNQFDQRLRSLQAQQQGGTAMRGLEQQRLDAMYQDWQAQRNYPQQQAGFMANIIRGGSPATQTQNATQYTPAPSMGNTLGGLAAIIGSGYLADKGSDWLKNFFGG